MTGIKREDHWMTDYSYVPFVAAAPSLFHFTDDKRASAVCYVLAATVLGYSLLTNAKWGAVKLIPYRTHAVLDVLQGTVALAALATAPEKTDKAAKGTLLAMGLTGVVVGILSLIGAKRS